MLTLSENAATVLAQTRSQQGIPEAATLRVASAAGQDEQGISLGFVDQPEASDQTAVAHGMPICVAADVADALDDVEIDVDTSGDNPQLVLVPVG